MGGIGRNARVRCPMFGAFGFALPLALTFGAKRDAMCLMMCLPPRWSSVSNYRKLIKRKRERTSWRSERV